MSSRAELFASVLRDLNREDKEPYLAEWLTSAEFRINAALRIDDMIKRTVTDLDEKLISPPIDFVAVKQLSLLLGSGIVPGTRAGDLGYMPSNLFDEGNYELQSRPTFYTTRGKVFEFIGWTGPGPYQLDMRYYAELPKLPNDESTNWFLDKAPHVYREAMLHFGFRHLKEYDTANTCLTTMTQEITFLNDQDQQKQIAGPLVMRPPRKLGGRHS